MGYRSWRAGYPPLVDDDGPAGDRARADLAKVANVEQRKVNEMTGAELGYRYVASPVIDDIPGGPEHLFRTYQPTAWPGARLPHVWLKDGGAIHDHASPAGFTLFRLNPRADSSALAATATGHARN